MPSFTETPYSILILIDCLLFSSTREYSAHLEASPLPMKVCFSRILRRFAREKSWLCHTCCNFTSQGIVISYLYIIPWQKLGFYWHHMEPITDDLSLRKQNMFFDEIESKNYISTELWLKRSFWMVSRQ